MEREVKLAAPAGFKLPAMDGVVDGVVAGRPEHLDLEASYYDSAELVLARNGVTLRYRTGEPGPGWTLKLPASKSGSMLVRRELEFGGSADSIPPGARDLVRVYLRSRRLKRVARLRTHRTAVPLLNGQGERLAEVVDDIVTVYEGRRHTGDIHEVEVELADGTPPDRRLLRATVARLTAAGCLAAPALPKLVRALGDRAVAPAELALVELGPKPSLAELIESVIAAPVERMIWHDAGVRLGGDPEDVHQFRVATRRLRSHLKTFSPLFDPEWVSVLRSELQWLGTEIGAVRDTDVLRERLVTSTAGLPDQDAAGVALLLKRVDEQAEHARAGALDALRRHRYDTLIQALVDGAHSPGFTPAGARRARLSADRHLTALIRRQWRHLERATRTLEDSPSDAALHQVRIRAKQCRYALEAAAPVLGHPATRLATAVEGLQTVLGDQHDAVVTEAWLRDAARAAPRCALVAGQLIAERRTENARLRSRWPRAWREADKQAPHDWR